jgi:hypothetical protein
MVCAMLQDKCENDALVKANPIQHYDVMPQAAWGSGSSLGDP